MFGENDVMLLSVVYKWQKQFKNGRTYTKGDLCVGWLSDMVNAETMNFVPTLMNENHELMITNIFQEVVAYFFHNISCGSIHHILWGELDMRIMCARWIPRKLSKARHKISWSGIYTVRNI